MKLTINFQADMRQILAVLIIVIAAELKLIGKFLRLQTGLGQV